MRNGVPLASGEERRTSTTEQLGIGDLADNPLGTELECAAQCGEPARSTIGVDARGIDAADSTQEFYLLPAVRGFYLLPAVRGGGP